MKYNNWLISLFLALAFVILLTSLYSASQQKRISQLDFSAPPTSLLKPTVAPILTPSKTVEKISDWQLYTFYPAPQRLDPIFTTKNPSDWSLQITRSSDSQFIELSKQNYVILFRQSIPSGSVCDFGDASTFDGPKTDLKNVKYSQINGVLSLRYWSVTQNNIQKIYFCQKVDGFYQSPTQVGDIEVSIPIKHDQKTYDEIFSIIKSIKLVTPTP